jgi:hypothetical protein
MSNTAPVTFTETGAARSRGMTVTNFPPPGEAPRDWYAPVIVS